jgi:hypothetical protein
MTFGETFVVPQSSAIGTALLEVWICSPVNCGTALGLLPFDRRKPIQAAAQYEKNRGRRAGAESRTLPPTSSSSTNPAG